MSFARPEWLLLGLLAVPILALHLRRRRRVVVPSTLVWARVSGASSLRSSRRAPVTTLLLLLQLLALALLVLGLARPRLGGGRPDHWIVVVDASGGMQATDVAPSRLAAARSYLEARLRRDGGGGGPRRVSIVAMGSVPEVLAARLASASAARRAAAALTPTAADPDWAQLARVLPGLTRRGERTTVTILTDPADRKAAEAAVRAALAGVSAVQVKTLTFAGPHPSNLGLDGVTVTREASGLWRIAGEVRRYAGKTSASQVEVLFAAGNHGALPWTTIPVKLDAGGTAEFQTELKLPAPGTLEVRLPKDDLASDNHAYFVLRPAPRQIKVLEVGPGDGALERALTSISDVKVYRAPALPRSVSDYALVVIDGVHVDRRPNTSTWWLDAPPPGVTFGAPVSAPTATSWLSAHPLSRTVDWSAIKVAQADVASRLPGADVLLEAGGHPLVQARTTADGREVLSTFALKNSDWPTLTSFPAFVYDLVHWVAPDLGRAAVPACRAGRACALDPMLLASGARLLGPTGALVPLPDPWVRPQGAHGALSEPWLAPWLGPLFRPQQPGVYTLVDGAGRQAVAVNAFGSAFSALQPGGNATASGRTVGPAVWKVLLALALLVLVAEAWLAGGPPVRWRRGSRGLEVRRRALWGWRLAALALVVLALVDPPLPWPERTQQAVLITDDPALYAPSVASQLRGFRASARAQAGRGHRLGVVDLGTVPEIVSGVGSSGRSGTFAGASAWPGADLGDALLTATGMLSRGTPGRVIVAAGAVSTGNGLGDALATARARGLPVDVLPLAPGHGGDASVERLQVGSDVYPKAPFTVHGLIRSQVDQTATVRVLEDGVLKQQRQVRLVAGNNDISAKLTADSSGLHTVTMELRAAHDAFAANDRNGVAVDVRPEPRVAIVSDQPARAKVLVQALAQQGVQATVLSPIDAPYDVKGWLAYDAAILMDVPAIDLYSVQQEKLETWVRDYGGGLLILGGANSFGPGGYFDTPIERMSPLSSKIPRQAPQVALLFVLDRSGSMQQLVGDVSRLGIAKSATLDAVKLLNPDSLTGVVVFDTKARAVVPLQKASGLHDLAARLASVRAAGGTALYPALVEAFHELQGVKSMIKHVVVMSDGLSQPADFKGLMAQMRAAGITVSTVAISSEADFSFLQHIAALGKGVFHSARDVKALPSILAQETLLLSSNPVKTKSVEPVWHDRKASFLDGLPDTLPPLLGYVETTAKPQANVALATPNGTPLLASWRFGVGRVIAFASQGAGAWTADWLKVPAYAKLWSQAVRWTLSEAPRPGLNVRVVRQGDLGRIEVRAVSAAGGPTSGLDLVATVTGPGGAKRSLPLHQGPAGRYGASFPVSAQGIYHVDVRDVGTSQASVKPASADLLATYPARYALGAEQPGLLQAVASATGGRVLTARSRLFPARAPLRLVHRLVPQLWLLLALATFLVELALRYLSLRSWWAALRGERARIRSDRAGRGMGATQSRG